MSIQALSHPNRPSLQQDPNHQVIQLPHDNPSTRSLASLTSLRAETNSERPGRTQSTMGEIPSLTRLVPTRRTRQVVPKQDDETMIQSRIKHYIDEFVTLNYGLLIIFGLFLLMTQAFDVGFIGAIVAVQLVIGLHFLLLLKTQCTLETQDDKRKNGYKMLEDILTVILLFTIQGFISDSSSPNAVIALTAIFLANQSVKTWCLFSWGRKSQWRFDRNFNGLIFLFRFCAIVQVILVIVRCIHSFASWVYIFTPIYIIAGLLVLHLGHFLWMIFSKTGRTLWKPLTWNKMIGLSWMLIIPVIFAVGLVWCARYIAGLVDDDSAQYTIADRPLLLLFMGVIIVTMLALFSIYCFENAITLTGKYIACLFDISTENQARVLAIIKKLQEDYANSVEDRQIPEILLKVSNVYFKLVKKEKVKVKKSKSGGCKVSPTLEGETGGAQQQQIKIDEKPPADVGTLADIEKNDNTKCVICFDEKQDAVYLPCGHGGVCYGCAQEVIKAKGDCHLCRKPIRRLIRVETNDITTAAAEYVKVISVTKTN